MKTATHAAVQLGSARALTQADTLGEKMELVPHRFYVETAEVRLGSARTETRAVETGERIELIPGNYWPEAGASPR